MAARKGTVPSKRAKKQVAPRRGYGELHGAKPRMFRASPDVGEALDDEVARTGRTQSAVIDEGLRRTFWKERNYQETLERNFGGRDNLALGYLTARIITGIEHKMKSTVRDSAEVREQVAVALRTLVDSLSTTDHGVVGSRVDFVTGTPARCVVAEVKANLSEGRDMCWPLTDTIDGVHSHARPGPPLRPSLDELRDVFSFFAQSWFQPELF